MICLIFFTFIISLAHSWECGGDRTAIQHGPARERSMISRSTTLSPIRISYHYYNFDLGNSTLNDLFKNTLMPMVDSYFTTSLRVYSIESNIVLSSTTCQTITVPSEHQTTGVADADVVVYITVNSLTNVEYVAYAGSCELDTNGLDNVVAGGVVVNIPNFSDNAIDSWLAVMTHEMTHLLAFSQGLFDYWKNSNGEAYGTDGVRKTLTVRGTEKTFLVTPSVLAMAQEAFDCYSIQGLELEDAGGSGTAGSHWDKRIMMNDYMTAYVPTEPIFSNISLAAFKDTGWYEVDYTLAQMPYFGRKVGCAYFDDLCVIDGATSNSLLWCDTYSKWGCDYFALNKGGCGVSTYSSSIPTEYQYFSSTTTGGKDKYTDYCPYNQALSNGSCRGNSLTTSVLKRAIEVIGQESRCFESTLLQKPYSTSASVYAACYEVLSCTSTTVSIKIDTQTVTCNFDGSVITLTGFNGWFKCPSNNMVCSDVPCKNLCFARGSCGNLGVCNCFNGFGGDDCYYACSENCDQCDDSTVCTECSAGYALQDSSCVLSVTCTDNCETCVSASECSLCSNGFYLNGPLDCVNCGDFCLNCESSSTCSECQGDYKVVDGVCYISCPENCESCSSTTVCTECASNYQLNSGTCSIVCPDNCFTCESTSVCTACIYSFIINSSNLCSCITGYYSSNSQCTKCQNNCLTCSSATECTSCLPSYYISNSNCVSCPSSCATCSSASNCLSCNSGYVLVSNACVLCPSECSSCSADSVCDSCIVGYKLQSNACVTCPTGCYSCTTSECTICEGNYYLDSGACSSCAQNCVLCNLGSCLKCRAAYYLIGGSCTLCSQFCLKCKNGTCSRCAKGYFLDNNECVACKTGCFSCSSLNLCKVCSLKYFLIDSTCVECPSGCLVCTSNQKCSRCLSGFYFSKQKCEVCGPNCKVCKTYSKCFVCEAGYALSGVSCVS